MRPEPACRARLRLDNSPEGPGGCGGTGPADAGPGRRRRRGLKSTGGGGLSDSEPGGGVKNCLRRLAGPAVLPATGMDRSCTYIRR